MATGGLFGSQACTPRMLLPSRTATAQLHVASGMKHGLVRTCTYTITASSVIRQSTSNALHNMSIIILRVTTLWHCKISRRFDDISLILESLISTAISHCIFFVWPNSYGTISKLSIKEFLDFNASTYSTVVVINNAVKYYFLIVYMNIYKFMLYICIRKPRYLDSLYSSTAGSQPRNRYCKICK